MFPAGIRAAPFPAYAWLPPARLLLEPVNGSRTLYVDRNPHSEDPNDMLKNSSSNRGLQRRATDFIRAY